MQPIDLALFGERYGWIVVVIMILVQNGGKVIDGIISLMNAVARLLRQGGHDKQVVAKAESNQETTIIRHEMDAETTAQNNLINVQNRLLDIHDRTQEYFFKENERNIENTAAVRDALHAVRLALQAMEKTLSVLTQTVSRQAEAYASLECVKAGRVRDEEAKQR